MELNEALSQISEIRRQMARAGMFHGYRSVTAAFSGGVALLAAWAQAAFVPMAYANLKGYLWVWLLAAVASLVAAAAHMIVRCVRSDSPLQRDLTVLAAERFAPSLIAGALLTLAIVLFAHEQAWMLPTLWAILFGLGVLASRQVLPRAVVLVGMYYMMAGLVCLALTGGGPIENARAFSPWTMALIFGPGQFLAAAVLWWTLERQPKQDMIRTIV